MSSPRHQTADAATLANRLTAQLLSGEPATDPVAVATRLLAIQAQDPRGARLAVRARSSGLHASDVDRALTEDRTLVITWLNRGTLHLVASEDLPWLHALTAPAQATGRARRLAQEGLTADDAERAVRLITSSLADAGPLTRGQLSERLATIGVRTQGQAVVHLLGLASRRGLIVRGPMVGAQHAFVLTRDWLGESRPVDRDQALAELARRYLRGHGPADERDLAKWSGLPLRDVRAGLQAIAAELVTRPDGLLDLLAREPPAPLPPPRLLGPFDPILHGWRSTEPILAEHRGVITVNGIFRAIALIDGRAAATWRMPAGKVVLEPFAKLRSADAKALAADADAVARYLDVR